MTESEERHPLPPSSQLLIIILTFLPLRNLSDTCHLHEFFLRVQLGLFQLRDPVLWILRTDALESRFLHFPLEGMLLVFVNPRFYFCQVERQKSSSAAYKITLHVLKCLLCVHTCVFMHGWVHVSIIAGTSCFFEAGSFAASWGPHIC